MYFTTQKDTIFHTLFSTLHDIDYESFIFKITPDNIHIQSTDVAKISILDILIDKKYFNEYNVNKSCIIDLDINIINKICKIFNKKYDLKFEIKSNYLYIESIRNTENDVIKKFRVNTNYIDDNDLIDISKLIIKNKYEIDTKIFNNICSELSVFSDDINITLNSKNMCFSTSHDLGDIQYFLDNIKSNENINISCKIKFLVKFKLLNLFDSINFNIDNEKPLLLNLKNSDININYLIAPNYT